MFVVRPNLSVRSWGEHVVVFNPISASTHLVNPLAHELLEALRIAPRSTAQLVEHLRECGVDDASEARRHVEAYLDQFARFGLVTVDEHRLNRS